MSTHILRLGITSVLLATLGIFGCSSDDDSGGGGGTTPPPSGAILITEANAKEVIEDAIGVGDAVVNSIPTLVEVDQTPLAMDIINLVVDRTEYITSETGLNTPAGVDFSFPCDNPDGTYSGSYTDDGNTTTGTITFTNCTILGITLNGTVNFIVSFDEETGNFSNDLQGNISGSDGVDTATLTNLHFNETGNFFLYNYSINNYDYSVDFSDGGGFLVELLAAIVGDQLLLCPDSGQLLVTGANGTQARATINPDQTVTVEFNDGSGTFVEVTEPPPGSPFPCTDFFAF